MFSVATALQEGFLPYCEHVVKRCATKLCVQIMFKGLILGGKGLFIIKIYVQCGNSSTGRISALL